MLLGKQPYEFVWLLLTVLAVWRLTAFAAYEAGPFDVMVAVRRGLVRIGLGRLVGCFYCLSIWMSCLAVLVFPLSAETPLVILGVAGAAAIVERWLTGSLTTGENVGGSDDDQ
jgi:Protein of unknown function (DUF1360)